MLTMNESRVYFLLAGYNFEPDDITKIIGIKPTSVNRGGASGTEGVPTTSSWEFSKDISEDDEADVYTIIRKFISKMEPLEEKIVEATKAFNLVPKLGVVLSIPADLDEPVPEAGFSGRSVTFLAKVGAFIDIEICRC